MKDIRELIVKQIYIFPVDEIALSSLQRKNAINKIQEAYSLKYSPTMFEGIPNESQSLAFNNGEYSWNKKTYLINNLSIEPRRILLTCSSESKIADSLFKNLRELILNLDLRESKPIYKHILVAEETQCVVKLDFHFNDVFKNSPLYTFHEYLKKKITSYESKIEVRPSALRFKISYLQLPDYLKKHNLSLLDKDFVLEMRNRTDAKENIYYTSSPTDSETHFNLIKELEKRITSS